MPTSGPLVETYGRVHTDIRFSITNGAISVACTASRTKTLLFVRARDPDIRRDRGVSPTVARSLGVVTARVTGGEPLVRGGVVELVRQLAEVGFSDLAMTTNGTCRRELARPLAEAGPAA